MDKIYIIVDGSNIAFFKRTHKKKAKFQNLEIVIKYLSTLKNLSPIEWEIIVDASLRHHIDNKEKLEHAINTGKITQGPSKAESDEFFLEYFKRHPENTLIISNDNFKDYSINNLSPFKFAIIFDEIIIKPDLDVFLKSQSHLKNIQKVKINV